MGDGGGGGMELESVIQSEVSQKEKNKYSMLSPLHLLSTSVSLFLPCKLVHLYRFSRFHIYVLIYGICFSLSDLLHSV